MEKNSVKVAWPGGQVIFKQIVFKSLLMVKKLLSIPTSLHFSVLPRNGMLGLKNLSRRKQCTSAVINQAI